MSLEQVVYNNRTQMVQLVAEDGDGLYIEFVSEARFAQNEESKDED
jgi:hypothetical protein